MITITHYRHATSILEIDRKRILIDPVFAKMGTYPPIVKSKNNRRNPLTNLTCDYKNLLEIDGILITHNHNDHFDELAKKVIPKDMPILCQAEDLLNIKNLGFTNITSINRSATWLNLQWHKYSGYHGGHIFKKKLGFSSSYLIMDKKHRVYLTGDTLLTLRVKRNLKKVSPDYIIANGGGANIKLLGKLTMDNGDIIKLSKLCKNSQIVVVHMDTLNHCSDTREKLIKMIPENVKNIYIPNDGEKLNL